MKAVISFNRLCSTARHPEGFAVEDFEPEFWPDVKKKILRRKP